jgi:hypothetical protein
MDNITITDTGKRAEPFQAVFHSETVRELTEKLKSIRFAALLLENGGAIAEAANEALNLASRFITIPLRTARGRPPMRVQVSEVPLEDYDGRDAFGHIIPGAPERDDDPTSRGLSNPQPRRPGELKDLLATAEKAQKQNRRATSCTKAAKRRKGNSHVRSDKQRSGDHPAGSEGAGAQGHSG